MTALYRFYDADSQLLYVGITDRGPRRWREHMADKPWWPDVARVELEHHPSREAALAAETAAIVTEQPRHNIAGNGRTSTVTERPMGKKRSGESRLDSTESILKPDSLVGSFFHSSHERGWQGCVVAEPQPGVYLVELFSWMMGEPFNQQLVRLDTMVEEGWTFYDDSEWMSFAYDHGGVRTRWDRAREVAEGAAT